MKIRRSTMLTSLDNEHELNDIPVTECPKNRGFVLFGSSFNNCMIDINMTRVDAIIVQCCSDLMWSWS